MRRLLPPFGNKVSFNTLTLTCCMMLGLIAFSVLQSGCTETPTSQASEPIVPTVAFTPVEQPVQSDIVTVVQPTELLKLLPLAKTAPVFIDFTSEYCGECRAIAPIIASAKKRFANKVTFMMIDVPKMMDAPEKTAGRYLMMAFRPMYTPTLIAIKPGGIVVAVESGFKTSPQLDAMLNSTLPTIKTKDMTPQKYTEVTTFQSEETSPSSEPAEKTLEVTEKGQGNFGLK
jgi:thiol-disulfide isomerase/thioredoxin